MNIARVIVDVPASVVNQTFDYYIPESLQQTVQEGMRVIVPFGPRKITGFVVGRVSESPYEPLKEIVQLLDVNPVLTSELLVVGQWLAEQTMSLYITTFQAMLPQVLKAKYAKELERITDEPLSQQLEQLFHNQNPIPFNDSMMYGHTLQGIQQEINKGNIKINYLVKSKETKRYETIYSPEEKSTLQVALNDVLPQATRQKQILNFFIENNRPIEQSKLYNTLNIQRNHLKPLLKRKLINEKRKEVYRNPYDRKFKRTKPLHLTDEQKKALQPIKKCILKRIHETFLLHGVTGSGKTEVYLQAIAEVLAEGKEAIVLVPEISLTPQMVERFKGRFGEKVAVLHSGLSIGEKYDEWRKIHRKEVKVVVGARSAIFAPFENLGIIIIDEEHETTYKQEESPRYLAKEVAIKRAELNHCPVVLGSATPTLESFARAYRNVYTLLTLTKRTNKQPMPEINIVDMREELRAGNRTMFSVSLVERIKNRLQNNEQIVLLLNRRGYSTFSLCRDCGFVEQCPHCDISLTYHKRDQRLKCHYCLYEKTVPHLCPSCGSESIHFFGTGTERVQEELGKVIPQARVLRMDVDTTRRKGAHEKLLNKFMNKEADILLGTQMIAKGLDFEHVTLVGVLAADSMLHLPDFRSAERTFQLITQVSGRAGRHNLAGEVVVQTYTPDHYSIRLASSYDFNRFFLKEMHYRKTFQYPPYYYLVLIHFSHENKAKVHQLAHKARQILVQYVSEDVILLGPTVAPIERIKNRYRYQLIIKYRKEPYLYKGLHKVLSYFEDDRRKGLTLTIDTNPYQFM